LTDNQNKREHPVRNKQPIKKMNTHIYKVGQVISTVISKRRVEGDVIAVSGKAVETSIGRFTKRKGGYYVLEGKGTFSVYCGEFTLS